jgi:oligoribonuclease (3'-5' exoribonuclease)
MSRIQFSSEDIHPVVSEGGGVYSRKDRRLDKLSRVISTTTEKGFDVDVEASSVDERDVRKKQVSFTRNKYVHPTKISLIGGRSSRDGRFYGRNSCPRR